MPSVWKDKGRFNSRSKGPRLDEMIPIAKFENGKFNTYRFIGPAYTYAEHWLEILAGKEGGDKRKVKVRKLCSAYDPTTGDFTGECAYCNLNADTPRIVTLQNAINRDLQRREPRDIPRHLPSEEKPQLLFGSEGANDTYFVKDKGSESWTPVEPLKLSSSPSQRIADYAALNKIKGVVYGPEDPDYGFDLTIKYEDTGSPANAYFVDKGEKCALDDDELDYLVYKLDVEKPEDPREQAKNAEDLGRKLLAPPAGLAAESDGGGRRGGYLEDMGDDAPGGGDDGYADEPPARGRGRGDDRRSARDDRGSDRRSARRDEPADNGYGDDGYADDGYADEPPARGRGGRDEAPRRSSRDDRAPARRSARDDSGYDDRAPARRSAGIERRSVSTDRRSAAPARRSAGRRDDLDM